jgi:hypothetical protein
VRSVGLSVPPGSEVRFPKPVVSTRYGVLRSLRSARWPPTCTRESRVVVITPERELNALLADPAADLAVATADGQARQRRPRTRPAYAQASAGPPMATPSASRRRSADSARRRRVHPDDLLTGPAQQVRLVAQVSRIPLLQAIREDDHCGSAQCALDTAASPAGRRLRPRSAWRHSSQGPTSLPAAVFGLVASSLDS